MKPGRNDPCPCGSGKKYKRCCLGAAAADAASQAAPADLTWRRLRALLNDHAADMRDFVAATYGPSAMVEAWAAYNGDDERDLPPYPDIKFSQLFIPWFFHCWAPDPFDTRVKKTSLHDVTPTRAYLTAKGHRLDPLLRRYLESLLTAPFTFFEVVDCNPGNGLTLRDILTGEQHAVTERSASRGMQPGDLLFGQLASVDHLTMLEASNGFAISPIEKAPIIAFRATLAAVKPEIKREVLRDWDFELLELFHDIAERAFNPPLPILQNTDGEPISPHKLVFDLKAPPQAAFDALKHLALRDTDESMLDDATRDSKGRLKGVRITWKKRGNKIHASWDNTILGKIEIDGTRLVAEVNSAARADAVRKEIETALGESVRYRASEIQSAEKILADLRAADEARGGRGGPPVRYPTLLRPRAVEGASAARFNSNDASRPQRGALRFAEAETLGEHLIGVLAEQRRRQPVVRRRLRQAHRIGDHIDALWGCRMRQVDDDPSCAHLRIIEHFVQRIDGPAADTQSFEPLDPFGGGPRLHHRR
jgi:hypothetical protein